MPAYPHYRDSGVEWLGEVPKHWAVVPLKSMIQTFVGGSWGSEAGEDERDAQCIRATDFDYRRLVADLDSAPVRSFPQRDAQRRGLHRGELVMATSAGSTDRAVGAVVVFDSDQPALPTNFAARMVPRDDVDTWFLAYLHNALNMMGVTRSLTNQVTIANLDTPAYLASHGPLPPLNEQRAIAAYLDRETERIDALVAKKRLLIERLEEYRTALITRTVTSGLPPDAARAAGLDPSPRLKPSGVEWLGEVPEHWEVKELKRLLVEPLQYGANEPAELDDPTFPRYVRITDIDEAGVLRDETFRSLPPEVAAPYLLEDGDLLLARSGATVGKSFLYRPDWGTCAYAGYLIRARVDARSADARFVRYFTATSAYWEWLDSTYIQATIQNVSAERYASLTIPVPPVHEQHAIVAFLERQTARVTDLVERAEAAIERLQEYRTALITAAVTGKIDVRE